jgi:hypothetical protein
MLGKHRREGRVTVECPSEKNFRTGSRWDTSTVLGMQKHLLKNGVVGFSKPLISLAGS